MRVSIPRIAILASALVLAAQNAAWAHGTTRVQRSDGVVHEYTDVSIRLIDHREVRITSADGKGTLHISKGACSYAGDLVRCLPYRIVLDQSGTRHVIDVDHGTEYVNFSDSARQLPHSSMHVPAHGIVLQLLTAHGTSITVRGTFDGMLG